MTGALYIGLMSGTSLDGVDGVLIDLAPGAQFRVLGHRHAPYDAALRAELLALNRPGVDELHRSALAANGVARQYASVVLALLQQTGILASDIRALGAHGQTVRHRPLEFDGVGYTSQLLNAALLAELTQIDVVADFRTRDLAAGGQGAPLVPAFHQAVFGTRRADRAVLNIGGIANITLLPKDGSGVGHDCGPGNVLLDLWCQRHTGQAMDLDGQWGRTGRVIDGLLSACMADAFIQRQPPKSTGRDHFHAEWLKDRLDEHAGHRPEDVQCTLTHLTAQAAAMALHRDLPTASELLVCGGGAFNGFLLDCLEAALPAASVKAVHKVTQLDPMHVEAAAFAWLAERHLTNQPGNLPTATGSRGLRPLGALYPAGHFRP